MTQDEAMKLALEALKWCHGGEPCGTAEAITAIEEALAQPEQEPVINVQFLRQVLSVAIAGLYEHYKDDVLRVFTLDDLQAVINFSEPLRPQQVEDIYKKAWDMLADITPSQPKRHELQAKGEHPAPCARHCEANAFKIVIKNLKAQLAQPEQEPVAHCKVRPLRGDESFPKVEIDWVNQPIPGPLYTTPPQRKPLSNQKIIEMYNEPRSDAEMIEFARAIEAAHGIWPENSDCYGPDWTDRDGEYLK